jgi:hypothetical protein
MFRQTGSTAWRDVFAAGEDAVPDIGRRFELEWPRRPTGATAG